MVFVPGPAILDGEASISIELKDWDRAGDLASSLALFGWCVSHGGLALEVEFQLHGTVLAKADLHIPRPDVVAALARPGTPPDSGFHLRLSKLLIPPNAALDVMMWVERDGEISRVALGRLENLPPARLRTSYAERCQPLLLLGLGRSGTTYAMRLLSGHKDILVPGGHPYELRTPAWLWHAAHVLSAPGADASMHPDGFESRDAGRLGYNPYRSRDWEGVAGSDAAVRWQEEALPGTAVDFCKRQVDDFVLRCAGGRQPRYVAQKMLLSPHALCRPQHLPRGAGGVPAARLPRHLAVRPQLQPAARRRVVRARRVRGRPGVAARPGVQHPAAPPGPCRRRAGCGHASLRGPDGKPSPGHRACAAGAWVGRTA